MSIKSVYVQQKWEETKRQIQMKVSPSGKKFIQDMNLRECLEAEEKYKSWFIKHKYNLIESETRKTLENDGKDPEGWYYTVNNGDHMVVIHKYVTYLKPRIQELQLLENANTVFTS